ncbi:hypothetical protein KZP23_11510 [Echinicola marina]|uniref:DUF5995 family protein n=1 Tax=Echinicola marina TaxID=2859768 RepID=UPI001CF70CED|nr:DUF5995 family protein [Echinicola marina]UCS95589.1 hypothetical protein KZP23_11510 [Echinicola marina]
METIDEVISKMDKIVFDCQQTASRIGFFAILYRRVTIRIKEGIINKEFEDNARMEKLDIIFAQRFFDAYNLYLEAKQPSKSWFCAFETAEKSGTTILQHLLLGINAHINLDLGIAAVETMKNGNLLDIKNDFDKINIILSELVDGVKSNLSKVSPIFGFLIKFANGKDEVLLNFSIQIARDGAWKFANEYAIAANLDQALNNRDLSILKIGNKIAKPGRRLSVITKFISWTEWKSVPRVMDQLEVISKENMPLQLSFNKLETA